MASWTGRVDGAAACHDEMLDGIPVSWCAKADAGSDRSRILYVLHSRGGTASDMLTSRLLREVRSHWAQQQVAAPVMISVSFGRMWTLTPRPSAYLPEGAALLPFFVERLMPRLEERVMGGPFSGTRQALGTSIGSYNVLQIVQAYPGMFDRVTLICPALASISPFAPAAEVDAYIARTQANPHDARLALREFYRDLRTPEEWRVYDPLQVARNPAAPYPGMLVIYNALDQYGFAEGAQQFAAIARAQGADVDEFANVGMHCETDFWDEVTIAGFLR
jgi:hypothetical protein